MMLVTDKIIQNKLLLVEGVDAFRFFLPILEELNRDDIQIIDFGGVGNNDLQNKLRILKRMEKYEDVDTLVIARDAEEDAVSAVESLKGTLANVDLPVPSMPFLFEEGIPRVAFILFPGSKDDGGEEIYHNGTLEDLCLSLIDNDNMDCTNSFIDCKEERGFVFTRKHKNKLHAFLSGTNEYVGLKIGEATRAGAWDITHNALEPHREILRSM